MANRTSPVDGITMGLLRGFSEPQQKQRYAISTSAIARGYFNHHPLLQQRRANMDVGSIATLEQYIHCQSTYGYSRSVYMSYQDKALSRLYIQGTVPASTLKHLHTQFISRSCHCLLALLERGSICCDPCFSRCVYRLQRMVLYFVTCMSWQTRPTSKLVMHCSRLALTFDALHLSLRAIIVHLAPILSIGYPSSIGKNQAMIRPTYSSACHSACFFLQWGSLLFSMKTPRMHVVGQSIVAAVFRGSSTKI